MSVFARMFGSANTNLFEFMSYGLESSGIDEARRILEESDRGGVVIDFVQYYRKKYQKFIKVDLNRYFPTNEDLMIGQDPQMINDIVVDLISELGLIKHFEGDFAGFSSSLSDKITKIAAENDNSDDEYSMFFSQSFANERRDEMFRKLLRLKYFIDLIN